MSSIRTASRTSHSSTAQHPNLVVGWASGLVQVWPAEDDAIEVPSPIRRKIAASVGTPEHVLEVLAACDGQDEVAYRRRYAADAGAVLALTHYTETELLSAAVEVRGPLSPTTVLAILHAELRSERVLLAS